MDYVLIIDKELNLTEVSYDDFVNGGSLGAVAEAEMAAFVADEQGHFYQADVEVGTHEVQWRCLSTKRLFGVMDFQNRGPKKHVEGSVADDRATSRETDGPDDSTTDEGAAGE
jgi:hypothetical protein